MGTRHHGDHLVMYVNVESLSCIPGFCIRAMLSLKWTVKDSLLLYFFKALGLCVCMLSHFSRVQLFVTPQTGAPRPLCPWDSPGKNTGVSCHALLKRIFPTQGWNPWPLTFLRCRRILYCWGLGRPSGFV